MTTPATLRDRWDATTDACDALNDLATIIGPDTPEGRYAARTARRLTAALQTYIATHPAELDQALEELAEVAAASIIRLEDLGVNPRTYNLLSRRGLRTAKDIVDCGRERIFALPNMGVKSLDEIEQALAEHGLAWADEVDR